MQAGIANGKKLWQGDNHGKQLPKWRGDPGEFADIMLHDFQAGVLVAIEAKYLSRVVTDKDLRKNLDRLTEAAQRLNAHTVVFCLLLAAGKWAGMQRHHRVRGSEHAHLLRYKATARRRDPTVVLITWDSLLPCGQTDVDRYMTKRLSLAPTEVVTKTERAGSTSSPSSPRSTVWKGRAILGGATLRPMSSYLPSQISSVKRIGSPREESAVRLRDPAEPASDASS